MLNETMPIPSVISSLNTSLAILCSRWLLAVELPWMGHCQVNGISHTCRIWLHRVFLTVYSNDWRDSYQPPARLKRHTKKKKKQSMLKVVHTMLILWTVYVNSSWWRLPHVSLHTSSGLEYCITAWKDELYTRNLTPGCLLCLLCPDRGQMI